MLVAPGRVGRIGQPARPVTPPSDIPDGAIVDDAGNYVLDAAGNYITVT